MPFQKSAEVPNENPKSPSFLTMPDKSRRVDEGSSFVSLFFDVAHHIMVRKKRASLSLTNFQMRKRNIVIALTISNSMPYVYDETQRKNNHNIPNLNGSIDATGGSSKFPDT